MQYAEDSKIMQRYSEYNACLIGIFENTSQPKYMKYDTMWDVEGGLQNMKMNSYIQMCAFVWLWITIVQKVCI